MFCKGSPLKSVIIHQYVHIHYTVNSIETKGGAPIGAEGAMTPPHLQKVWEVNQLATKIEKYLF